MIAHISKHFDDVFSSVPTPTHTTYPLLCTHNLAIVSNLFSILKSYSAMQILHILHSTGTHTHCTCIPYTPSCDKMEAKYQINCFPLLTEYAQAPSIVYWEKAIPI